MPGQAASSAMSAVCLNVMPEVGRPMVLTPSWNFFSSARLSIS